jgi:glutaredoxin
VILTIYSKPGCHLCDDMKTLVQGVVQGRQGVSIQEVDISSDSALLERYELEVPVLLIDGKKAARFRITEQELTRRLEGF